jgi:hypothetical protein
VPKNPRPASGPFDRQNAAEIATPRDARTTPHTHGRDDIRYACEKRPLSRGTRAPGAIRLQNHAEEAEAGTQTLRQKTWSGELTHPTSAARHVSKFNASSLCLDCVEFKSVLRVSREVRREIFFSAVGSEHPIIFFVETAEQTPLIKRAHVSLANL